jgi:Tol biopolymer transport system component
MSYEGFNDGNPNGPQKDYEIYTINTDGTGQSRATNNRTNEYEPSYSPDGKRIVYYTGSHLRNPDVYTINVGGGGKSKVAEGWTPSWGSRP